MKNVTRPTINSELAFENIANSKRAYQVTLTSLKKELFNQYAIYEKCSQNLESVSPLDTFSETDKKALIHCYEVSTKPLEDLKITVFDTLGDVGKAYCPYCLISEPRTIDHYLPKVSFPEFSVLALNLIPCCFDCNNARGNVWLAENGRSTINVYFDSIENKRFLYASFSIEDDIPQVSFSLRNKEAIPSYVFKIIENHFNTFKLQNRYRNQINNTVSEIFSKFNQPRHKLLPDNDKKELLMEEVISYQNNNGKNYWKAVVIEALACSEFIYKI